MSAAIVGTTPNLHNEIQLHTITARYSSINRCTIKSLNPCQYTFTNPRGFILARISFPVFSAWLVSSPRSNFSYTWLLPAEEHKSSTHRELSIFCVLDLCTAGKELNCSYSFNSSEVYRVDMCSLSWNSIHSCRGLGSFTCRISRET